MVAPHDMPHATSSQHLTLMLPVGAVHRALGVLLSESGRMLAEVAMLEADDSVAPIV